MELVAVVAQVELEQVVDVDLQIQEMVELDYPIQLQEVQCPTLVVAVVVHKLHLLNLELVEQVLPVEQVVEQEEQMLVQMV
jgi:hypothetical protein|tara:strand:+ start:113 stop:355 length:243 start_codon:yes stop_codon:yes gene_type:complete